MRHLRTTAAVLALLGLGCTSATRTNTPSPTVPTGVGVIVMAHGGTPEWNSSIHAAVRPVAEVWRTSIAFGMADPKSLRAAYLQVVSEFRAKLRTGCLAERIDVVDMNTRTPLDVALSSYLAKRAAQARAGRGAAG